MKKILIALMMFCCCVVVSAQMTETLKPISFAHSLRPAPELQLSHFDLEKAHVSDGEVLRKGGFPLFSRNISVDINLQNSGSWTVLPNGARVWRVTIVSQNAMGIVPLFEKLYLPKGAMLHVYMPNHKEVLGAFTHENTPEPRAFCPGLLHGDNCVIEYYEPAGELRKGVIEMVEVGHAYRMVYPLAEAERSLSSGSCEVNVACSETNNFLDQKRSVARIMVVATGGQGYCSGTLINNVRQDCTPYFLTAQHCSEGTTANQYAQWVFYFNYEATSCNGTAGAANKTVTGCTKISESNDNGGDTGSDFLLLQLTTAPNTSYNVFYTGWNSANTPSSSGVSIHHPDGDIKKISTYTTPITSTSWGSVANTHWNVEWAATANGHGVTEEGSSGGALFNSTGQVIGTLTGGGSFCNATNQPDQFGKFSFSWINNGTTNNRRLKPWLDPDNTGTLAMAGTNSPCGSTIMNDAGIQAVNTPDGNLCAVNSVTPEIVLRNFGGNTITSVIINYTIDGNVFQYTYNGNLTAGSTTTVTLPQATLNPGNHSFSAETVTPNGQTDGNTTNDAMTVNFSVYPSANQVNVSLHTDEYGSETSWKVKDAFGNIVAEEGPYSDVNNGQQINTSFCLGAGCYVFTLYDDYGDGISDPFAGSLSLTGNGSTYATLSNPNFGDSVSFNFCITATDVSQPVSSKTTVLPNPSSGVFLVSFAEQGEKEIVVYDLAGRVILQQKVSDSRYVLDLSLLSKSIYLLQINSGENKEIQKLSVK